MANTGAGAYGLTILSPIRNGYLDETTTYADETFKRCMNIRIHERSPFAEVPNTYLARLFVLNDVLHESKPANDTVLNLPDLLSLFKGKYRLKALPKVDRLKSRYLVFSSNFHGESKQDLDRYLRDLWRRFKYVDYDDEAHDISHIWQHCVAFDKVRSEDDFVAYMKKCQLETTLFFNGSNGDSLKAQLKALYVKQEFSRFAVAHQGQSAATIQQAWQAFIERVRPDELDGPSWKPGQSTLQEH